MVSGLPEVEDLLNTANELAAAGKPEEALRGYDAVIAAEPLHPLAWVGKASVLKALSRYGECANCFDAALEGVLGWDEVAPEDLERRDLFVSMLWVLKAEALLYAERPLDALAAVDAADALRAPDAASLVVRGQAHAQRKEYEEAGNCLYRAEEWCNLFEDSMLTQVWLCKVQLAKEAGGRLAPAYAAEMYARHAGWRAPSGTAEELLERGNNLRNAGLLYDALRYYDAALAAGPKSAARILFYQGVIFEQLRRPANALDCYNDALRAGPLPEDEFRIRVRREGCRAGGLCSEEKRE